MTSLSDTDHVATWTALSRDTLTPRTPFAQHIELFERTYANYPAEAGPPPAWVPSATEFERSNIARLMRDRGFDSYAALHAWSVDDPAGFWGEMIDRVGIVLKRPHTRVVDFDAGVEHVTWLPGAELNIADSCFTAPPDAVAVIEQSEGGPMSRWTYGALEALTNRVANGVQRIGLGPGDTVAVLMPMNMDAIAMYLGLVKAGCTVVSIAESFSPPEIETRLRIGRVKTIFVQDVVTRGTRVLPLFEKIAGFDGLRAIVHAEGERLAVTPRPGDLEWATLLSDDTRFESIARRPDDVADVLFSSGTTGDPKAIPWTHTTPIKCAVDAFLHQDVQPGDVLAWPTSLGWMMGPWLIFASLVNHGTMALFQGAPTGASFCRFVEDAGVTMLGVVPTLVKAWRASGAIDSADWTQIKLFSSTGECSKPHDMLYLMSRAGYRPVIEYCGGTEIGGGYLTGTVVQPCAPATFTTPALGLDFVILGEDQRPAPVGEVFLRPPSMGLSLDLLNRDHHETYFADTPRLEGRVLRRHGDSIERLGGGFLHAIGRTDDTMNLGGIKVGSAELERVLVRIPGVAEVAAIGVAPPEGGPESLVVYAVPRAPNTRPHELRDAMQRTIRSDLNPLFKIADVVVVDRLPRTASNKVMRRVLRQRYVQGTGGA